MTKPNAGIAGIIFPFNEVIQEFEVFKKLGAGYVESRDLPVIDSAKRSLEAIQSNASTSTSTPWTMGLKDKPELWTTWSEGHHARDGKGPYRLRAGMSFIWEIRPLEDKNWGKRKYFALDGNASILIQVEGRLKKEEDADCELASWRVEVGDTHAPGHHFHVQIKEYDHKAPFPIGFDVPRLPSVLMTPLLAFESVIAELFQDGWRKQAIEDNVHVRAWRNIHQPRLARFFEWQQQIITNKSNFGSAWAVLKSKRPEADFLVRKL